jgi:hypothetical protein
MTLPGTGVGYQSSQRSGGRGCLKTFGMLWALVLGLAAIGFLVGGSVATGLAAAGLALVVGLLSRAPRDPALPSTPTDGGFVWAGTHYERRCPNPECAGAIRLTKSADVMSSSASPASVSCGFCGAHITLNGFNSSMWNKLWEEERRVEKERSAVEAAHRRSAMSVRFGDKIAEAIMARTPYVGATQEVIREMLGAPENVAIEKMRNGERVTWRYDELGSSGRYGTRVRFTSGLCDQWKLKD